MAIPSTFSKWIAPAMLPIRPSHLNLHESQVTRERTSTVSPSAAARFSILQVAKSCQKCGGKGAIECPGCKGTGKNKKNGNIFERWKCFDCQGFGLRSCPSCGKGGLTPEQRGER